MFMQTIMDKVGLKQNGRFYYGWVMVFIGFLLMVFAYVGSISITSVFVVPVTESLDIDRSTFMLYQTILTVGSVVVTGYFGKRMARGNIKIIMFLSAISAVIGYVLFANAQSIAFFYIGAILIGVGFANCTVLPISIIINNWFGGKIRGTVMGFSFIGSGIGGLIILPQLNKVISEFGWRSGYYVLAGLFALVGIILLIFIVKTPEEKGFTRMGQVEGETSVKNASGMMIKKALKTPMLWLALLSTTLTVFGSSAILFNSAPFFIEVGFTPEKAALFASFNLGMLAAGKFVIGFICDRLGTKFGSIFAALVFGAQFVFLALLPTNPNLFIWLAILCYGIGGGGITVCPPLLVNALFGEKDYGNIVATMNMATNFGGAFGGIIAATIFDFTGSYVTFWWIAAVAMVIVALFRVACFMLRKNYDYEKDAA